MYMVVLSLNLLNIPNYSLHLLSYPFLVEPHARFSHSTSVYLGNTPAEDRMIVFGGRYADERDLFVMEGVWSYNFEANSWERFLGNDVVRWYHVSGVYQQTLVVFGGKTLSSATELNAQPFAGLLATNIEEQKCVGNTDVENTELWCKYLEDEASVISTKASNRMRHNGIVRKDQFIMFGMLYYSFISNQQLLHRWSR